MSPRRHSFSDTELAAIINQAVTDALAARDSQQDSDRSVNPPPPVIEPCSYKDFLSCKPPYFDGTKGAIGLIRWIERMESAFNLCNCSEDDKVKFAAYTFRGGVLTWWNTHVTAVGIEASNQTRWSDLKEMLKVGYCPNNLEDEFWNLKVQGNDIVGYTTKFQQLALLCPTMVEPETKRIARYIRGLPENIQGSVAFSEPPTIHSAIQFSHELVAMMVDLASSSTPNNKRRFSENTSEPFKKPNTVKAYPTNTKPTRGSRPFCSKCYRHHRDPCGTICSNCNRCGHLTKNCRAPKSSNNDSNNNVKLSRACFKCGITGHYKNECPKLENKRNNNNNNARRRAFVPNTEDARQDPNAVTGMFFLNNLTTSALFDSSADRSFTSDNF